MKESLLVSSDRPILNIPVELFWLQLSFKIPLAEVDPEYVLFVE